MSIRKILRNLEIALAAVVMVIILTMPALAAVYEAIDRRVALIIGNSNYKYMPELKNASKDAVLVKETLEQANFDVTLGIDLSKKQLENKIQQFIRGLSNGDVALFYYSGHAIQVGGINYILSTDTALSSQYDLEVEAYSFNSLLQYMQASSSLQIAVFDACRKNPFKNKSYYVGEKKIEIDKGGLASIAPGKGTLIIYSTAPDEVAYDGGGDISPFSDSFSDKVLTPNKEIRQILTDVRKAVIEKTNGLQVPWDVSSLTSSFYFVTRRNIVIFQDLVEVHASKTDSEIPLNIPTPISTIRTNLTVKFRELQSKGTLWLGDQMLTPSKEISADQLPRVSYRGAEIRPSVELIHYTVNNPLGASVNGTISVIWDLETNVASATEAEQNLPRKRFSIEDNSAQPAETAGIEPELLYMDTDVGTGFVAIPQFASLKIEAQPKWMRVTARDPKIQIVKGNIAISEGDLIGKHELGNLRIRPSLTSTGQIARFTISPVKQNNNIVKPVVIILNATVNACDTLAGQPFDIQGVTEGVLPNEIKIKEAELACRFAIDENPDIARYHFQYGRVLFAMSNYREALAHFQTALDGGHVRAGYSIGRLYQLGSGLPVDPAKAIALFEAGAQKGDSYAQYSLGRAKLSGKGTSIDTKAGMKLLIEAAQSGHTYALNQLGSEYLSGKRIAKDIARAHRFFTESAARSDTWGMVNLGFLYRDGIFVEKDVAEATRLFTQAHNNGHPYAGTLIGSQKRKAGGATSSDLLVWFRESANRGDAWGAYYAALILKKTPVLAGKNGGALKYFAKSASQKSKDVSDRSLREIGKFGKHQINIEIQKTLQSMSGENVGIDGILGSKSRQLATALLKETPLQDSTKLLIQLVRQEWINSKPRLDLL